MNQNHALSFGLFSTVLLAGCGAVLLYQSHSHHKQIIKAAWSAGLIDSPAAETSGAIPNPGRSRDLFPQISAAPIPAAYDAAQEIEAASMPNIGMPNQGGLAPPALAKDHGFNVRPQFYAGFDADTNAGFASSFGERAYQSAALRMS